MKKAVSMLLCVLLTLTVFLPAARAEEGEGTPAPSPAPEVQASPTPTPAQPSATPEPSASAAPSADSSSEPEKETDPTPAATAEATPEAAVQPTPQPTVYAWEEEPEPTDGPEYERSLAFWEEEYPALLMDFSGIIREDVLRVAQSQIGYSADPRFTRTDEDGTVRKYTRYGEWLHHPFGEWCDMFVSFCASYGCAGEDYPVESSCHRHMQKLREAGYWREWNNYIPQPGDLVFICMDEDRHTPNHVGVVEEVLIDEQTGVGTLVTIEGNMTNFVGRTACVRRETRDLSKVIGYGTYDKGTVYSAELKSRRSDGKWVIDEDSPFFVDYPTREALLFLGLAGSSYFNYWFPPEELPADEQDQTEEKIPAVAEIPKETEYDELPPEEE
ncbi:MAG: CHAP domain-containing protein [Clostridia bacterium]|nr:CHAP domain-containing protein [Clostridia bacterium]